MAYRTINQLKEMSDTLLDLARRVGPEGEGLDLLDNEFELEELQQLRSHLSSTRRAVDVVNKALAIYWDETYPNQSFQTEYDDWYVGQTKGKRIVHEELFYEWLAGKDADELSKLVSATAIKVGGMTPAERDTHLDETPRSTDVSILNRPRR